MRPVRVPLLVVFLALLAVPARAAAQPPAVPVLQPGDLLRVQIWREGDLSGEFPVDERGRVVLPLLGVREVGGMTITAVRDTLMADYARQLRNPSINITPLRRVNVLGEVNRPGTYPVDPTVSLAEVVAIAGGAGPEGDLRRIDIVRGGSVVRERIEPGASLASMDVRSGDQVFVGRRSWMDRNSGTLVAGLLSAAVSIVASLIISNNNQ